MALKKKISKADYEKLSDVIKAEYKANGDDYILDLDGDEDTGALKRAKDREKELRVEAETKLAEALRKLEEGSDIDARKKGDIETLEKSWQKKLADRETELTGKLSKSQEFAKKTLLDGTASTIASKISTVPALMAKALKERLHVDFDGDEPTLRVLDANGKPSALSVADLEKEFLTNKEFSSIIIGSKASGSANRETKISSGATDEKAQPFSVMKPKELAATLKEKIEAQKNNE